MLAGVVPVLRCPVCGSGLHESAGSQSLTCERRHSFDVARQGYVNLIAGGRQGALGDTADMVAARDAFLRLGHLDALSDALASAAARASGAVVADAGGGTGHHLVRVLDALPRAVGVAMDVSPYAARRAARAHPRIGAVVCDVWRGLPLRDHAVDVLLDVFAPRNGAEFHRVLTPSGRLFVVTPTPRHLTELVGALGLLGVDERKEERLAESLEPCFDRESSALVETAVAVERGHVPLLVGMGPSAWHVDPDDLAARTARLPERVDVTVSCRLAAYRPRSTPPPLPPVELPPSGA